MKLLDDTGRLFGVVNVIDALVVLLLLASTIAGATLLLGDQGPTETTTETTVTLQIQNVQPFVAKAVPTGSVPTDSIVAVRNMSVEPATVIVQSQNGTLYQRKHPRNQTVTATVTLITTEQDSDRQFEGEPLEIGRRLKLDFGDVTVHGTVTKVEN